MADDPLIGKFLDGRYEITEILGKGGMATVYRANQPAMGRNVAIKVMSADISEDESFRERFQHEARVIAKLEHPHILPVYDVGNFEGQIYLVMRLLESGDLKDRMTQKPLNSSEILRLLTQLASALAYAHELNIVHRDLKPQNILMDAASNPYLTDFGIAKSLQGTSHVTMTGMIMGTPAYMAPEQWRSQPVDGRTDIYALGVLAYLLFTGELPFEADTPYSLMYLHLDKFPDPLETKNRFLSPSLTRVIFKAIAKDPIDRYNTATEFARDLENVLQTSQVIPSLQPADEHNTFSGNPDHATLVTGRRENTKRHGKEEDTDDADSEPKRKPQQGTTKNLVGSEPAIDEDATTPIDEDSSKVAGRSPMLALAAAGVVVALLAFAVFMLNNDNSGEEADGTATVEVAQVITEEVLPTETDIPSETPTDTPSETPTASDTPTTTLSPTPSEAQVQVIVGRGFIYAEPNTLSDELTVAPEGTQLQILGRTPDDNWYLVSFAGQTGWIFSQQVTASGPLNEVEVIISSTPTPSDTPTDTPSPTLTETPTPTLTFTPSETPTETPSPTFTPSPTSILPTNVPCILTAQSGEVNLRSQPNTSADSAVLGQMFGGDSLIATAQTADDWYLTDQGWLFGSVVSKSSLFVCGGLPVISVLPPSVPTPVSVTGLCDVLTTNTVLYSGVSSATTPITVLPPSTTLSVSRVASGDGIPWYEVRYINDSGIIFAGWISSATAGPVAGSCPPPPPGVSIFGNPFVNPLLLNEQPDMSDDFANAGGGWSLFVPGADLGIDDGQLRLILRPQASNSLISENPALGGLIQDGFVTTRLTIPPAIGQQYFVELIVRGFYSIRLSELGNVAVAAEANPSLLFGSTPDQQYNLNQGVTLGVHMQGELMEVYLDGKKVLEINDDERLQGVLLRFRVTNRSTNQDLTLLVDDFAYWNFTAE